MIGWPRTLSWSDFTAVPNPGRGQLVALNGHPIVARVGLAIAFFPGSSPRPAHGRSFNTVDVRVVTNGLQYVPSRIPAGESDYYLRHEQGHMDLMGLFARELEVALLALRAETAEELTQQAAAAVEEAVTSARAYAINTPRLDCTYDIDTHHGMLRHQQERWNTLIAQNVARWRQPDFRVQTG
jgi:hypothetical protein